MNTRTSDNELTVTRLLDAPRELVFDLWTDPEHIKHWWGPIGFSLTTKQMNAVSGGEWTFTMHGPDGRDYLNRIRFDEVRKPERITYHHSGDDDTEDIKFNVEVLFRDMDGKTELTMRMIFATKEELDRVAEEFGAIEGQQQTIARLEQYINDLTN